MADSQEEVGELLAYGLTLIQEGQEVLESWLGYFPQYREILRPPLEAARWLQVRSPIFDPHPEFILSSRRNLVHQILVEQSLRGNSRSSQTSGTRKGERLP
jgi:hypothetical protein